MDHDSSEAAPHQVRLEARGYHVTKTSDVDTALALARQSPPRAIFLTVDRLGSERTPFLQALRRDDQTRHVPVTFLHTGRDYSLEHFSLTPVGRHLW